MIGKLLTKVVGSRNDRVLKKLRPTLARVNELEDRFRKQSDEALAAKTVKFRERLDRGESLDDMLPEAFAAVREAGRRALNMRHYDVQILGGVLLHQGTICEMKTGEGKTLVATLALYLNGLAGKCLNVVEVYGTQGTAVIDYGGGPSQFLSAEGEAVPLDADLPYAHRFDREIDHFIRCILGEDTPTIGADEGVKDLQVLEAAFESVQTGKTVALEC